MKTKTEILRYLIKEERKIMTSPPRWTRRQNAVGKSYVRLICKIRILGWIKELRELK